MIDNNITIIGNLTRDPELRHTQKGTALASLGVAWNRRYQQNGQDVEDVSFFNITCWGTLAENVANSSLMKGSRVVVVGRLNQNTYETRDGESRSTVEIVADEVSPSLKWATAEVTKTSGGATGGGGGGGSGGGGGRSAPAGDNQAAAADRQSGDSQVSPAAQETSQQAPQEAGAGEEPF